MSLIALRFYNYRAARANGCKFSWVSWLVSRRSSPRTHVEMQFSDRYDRISFSATLQDGDKGCRFKQINYTHAAQWWDTIWVEVTDEQEDEMYCRAKLIEGQPYDLAGLLFAITDKDIIQGHPRKKWCSKAVAHITLNVIYDGLLAVTPEYYFEAWVGSSKVHHVDLCEWSLKSVA
jgi:hypothetical protein